MAMSALLTLSAMYSYKSDLFDNLVLPTPPIDPSAIGLEVGQLRTAWTINKEDLIDFICLRTMGMSLCYPDGDFMKNAIGVWSRAHIHEWQRLFDTLFYKYNPLWNKDGKITESGQDDTSSDNSATSNGTNTDYTHGYDGGTVHTDDGLAWSHASKNKGNTTGEAHSIGSVEYSHTTVEQGNIGVTKTSELISEERKIALFSIDEYLADEFMKQFCLMLW